MSHWPNASVSAVGWTCWNCGGWVPQGNYHSCPTTTIRWANPPIQPAPSAHDRIAAALERIATALERQHDDSHVSAPSSSPST